MKSKLIDTYCLDLYGSQLWKYSKNDVNAFYIAWWKVVRQIWKIPSTTHCNLLPAINKFLIEKRCAKSIWSCFNSHNLIVRNISMAAKISSFSDFGNNYRWYECYRSCLREITRHQNTNQLGFNELKR